jgi:hypothetical protein
MTITNELTKNIICKLLKGEDYRIEVINLINLEFMQFAVAFFKKVAIAKFEDKKINGDWYKNNFLNSELPSSEIAINSGLNKKTIHNMYNSSTKDIVINASNKHYDTLYKSIENLLEQEQELDLILTIKFKGVSVDLNVNESLIVINALAVKRAELRGGLWSAAGKKVEQPLMNTLCALYSVSDKNLEKKYKKTPGKSVDREIDFYLVNETKEYKCEVKLMGKDNPESADAVIARESDIFIADKLSEQNKSQLKKLNIHWIDLRSKNGYKRFGKVLEKLKIPHTLYTGNLDKDLPKIFKKIFK